jgi:hypothetical protein
MLKVALVSAALTLGALAGPANIQGTWILLIEGHQIGLAIEQDGQKLTGTLQIMGKMVPVDGEIDEQAFTLAAEAAQFAGHGQNETVPLVLTGKLNDDGNLEGEISTARGRLKWTGERLKRPVSR